MLVVLAASTTLSTLAGCVRGAPEVRVTEGFSAPGTTYGRVLRTHTSGAELYRGFDTVAKGWATWRSPALREALAEASIEAYRLGGEEAERIRREEERTARRIREFHLALYTPEDDWNDLHSPDTLWRAYLELPDGRRLEPVRVIRLPKSEKSPVEYPYVSPWTREYTLLFPRLPGESPLERFDLVLAGPLGALRFPYE